MTGLEHRMDRLERQNRRQGRLLVVLLACAAIATLGGQVARKYVPRVVRAQAIELVDADGRVLAALSGTETGGRLVVADAAGLPRVEVQATETGGSLLVLNRPDAPRVSMTGGARGGGFTLFSNDGRPLVEFGGDDAGGVITISTRDGQPLVTMAGSAGGEGRIHAHRQGASAAMWP